MNIRLRYKIGIVVAVLGGMFLWGRCNRPSVSPKPLVPPITLPVDDKEQIRVDPVKHTITMQTPTGTKTVTLPDRVSTIDIRKDGTVKVTSPQFGFQLRPFVGGYYSDALRFGTGADLGYYKKLNLGLGIAGGASTHTTAFAQLSYNVYSGTSIGVTYDHLGHVGGSISIRL